MGTSDPKCYLAAAQILEVAPNECIVFEDAASGVQAAAGMRCIGVALPDGEQSLLDVGSTSTIPNFDAVALRVPRPPGDVLHLSDHGCGDSGAIRPTATMMDLAPQAQMLRSLHHGGEPRLLPNVWDVASARAVADAQFPVIATSSLAVSISLGFPDSDVMPAGAMFDVIARIATGVDVPVTADLEAGDQLPAGELVERLLSAGRSAATWRTPIITGPMC